LVELVKLYYRIGEVAQIVGVQPHVLRYWETEFRTIRPQKSGKGQRVYSRKDVEKLLRVKDLLKNQGFTIAGAKKKLREPGELAEGSAAPAVSPTPELPLQQRTAEPERIFAPITLAPAPSLAPQIFPTSVPPPAVAPTQLAAPSAAPVEAPAAFAPGPRERAAVQNQARVRDALLALRAEMVEMLGDFDRTPPRRPKLPSLG
jgi:DNA-binding transcriptional MerR regulator